MHLPEVVVRMRGEVLPPSDLLAAARACLEVSAFEELVRETQGHPTPDQLVAKVEARRHA